MRELGWGIVGCGAVTEVKSGPALAKAKGSRVVAVMRRSPGLAEAYARRHGIARWYDDVEALIRDPEVDAVYVATPPGAHLEVALLCAAANKPAYVEKPMARNSRECVRMLEGFGAAKVPLFVAYYRRALPRFVKVKALLEEGRIGAVTSVSYRYSRRSLAKEEGALPWRLVASESGGGLFLDLGCHTLDLLDWLLGPLEAVSGSAMRVSGDAGVEEVVAMHFRTQGGALGAGVWNFASEVYEDEAVLTGTLGRISFATFGEGPIRLLGAGGDERVFEISNPPHIQEPLIQSIVDELRGEGLCPSTGESAARTSRVMDKVLEDYYGGREDDFWDRPARWPGSRATVAISRK